MGGDVRVTSDYNYNVEDFREKEYPMLKGMCDSFNYLSWSSQCQ